MCGLGDCIAQVFIERRKRKKYDMLRTARMATIGLFFTVSICSFLMHKSLSLENKKVLTETFDNMIDELVTLLEHVLVTLLEHVLVTLLEHVLDDSNSLIYLCGMQRGGGEGRGRWICLYLLSDLMQQLECFLVYVNLYYHLC